MQLQLAVALELFLNRFQRMNAQAFAKESLGHSSIIPRNNSTPRVPHISEGSTTRLSMQISAKEKLERILVFTALGIAI